MAALCFQESRFKQNIKNEWGAIGLFQIKQSTADEPYINITEIEGPDNFENNIHAGIKYLHWIKKTYFDEYEGMSEKNKGLEWRLLPIMQALIELEGRLKKLKSLGLNI